MTFGWAHVAVTKKTRTGADALLLAIEDLEHPYLILHANGGQYHERDIDTRIGLVHSLLNDHIAMIIGDASSSPSFPCWCDGKRLTVPPPAPHCFRNPYCAKSEENPGGVEPHKLFIFEGPLLILDHLRIWSDGLSSLGRRLWPPAGWSMGFDVLSEARRGLQLSRLDGRTRLYSISSLRTFDPA